MLAEIYPTMYNVPLKRQVLGIVFYMNSLLLSIDGAHLGILNRLRLT